MDEQDVSRLILEGFAEDFKDTLDLDVAIVGAGPSGITAARLLASQGFKVAVFERNLHVGGGMWGGGMLFPRIVVQEEALPLLSEIGVRAQPVQPGLYLMDSVETVTKCTAAALDAGARIWVGISVEDVVIREQDEVSGVVINWSAVVNAGLHVDPLALRAKAVIDATGHDTELTRGVLRKIPGASLPTQDGTVMGERPMWAEVGEAALVGNTREVYPGLVVAGMAANAVFASPRMGAVFGGMFLSGARAAELAGDIARKKQLSRAL